MLDRKPSKCVVFEDDPRGVTAAHNCTMMVVALIGAHPAYDLGQADLAAANFGELSVINLRKLFANKGSTFMDLIGDDFYGFDCRKLMYRPYCWLVRSDFDRLDAERNVELMDK
ncbi:hypothetical protein PIB30_061964 [Stylosanthes scabra]|uniref:Uncharacterized protein n=1 Tax=Stylosanthes scabra TaxID=79078 RepID=A0ABU6QKH1_9FABA|nr:hypothetical protein [Stylosanthes scabra]